MSDAEAIPPTPRAQSDAPIHFAECGHYNEREALTCGQCGAHLWVKCSRCKAKSLRSAPRCAKCHKLLHRGGFSWPRFRLWPRHKKRRRLLRACLLILALLAGAILVYRSLPESDSPGLRPSFGL